MKQKFTHEWNFARSATAQIAMDREWTMWLRCLGNTKILRRKKNDHRVNWWRKNCEKLNDSPCARRPKSRRQLIKCCYVAGWCFPPILAKYWLLSQWIISLKAREVEWRGVLLEITRTTTIVFNLFAYDNKQRPDDSERVDSIRGKDNVYYSHTQGLI
jgi:hypothetical protein